MGKWELKLKLRLPALILLVVTSLFWTLYDRYEGAGPALLFAPALADAARVRGDCSEAGGRLILRVPESGTRASVHFRLPTAADYSHLRVRARVKVDGVVVGTYPWSGARLVFAQYDTKEKWIAGRHRLMEEFGSTDWEPYEKVFETFPDAAYAEVALQQIGSAGSAEFEQIEVLPVRFRASFIGWRVLFTIWWVGFAVYYFPRCRLHQRRLKTLILLNVIAILCGTLMPGVWISQASDQVKEQFRALQSKTAQEKPGAPAQPPAQKEELKVGQMEQFEEWVGGAHRTGHFVLFASLCFLVYLSAALERQHPSYFAKVGGDIMLFAGITESLQFLTLDRKAGVSDLLIDVYGMAAALLLFICILPLVHRRLSKRA